MSNVKQLQIWYRRQSPLGKTGTFAEVKNINTTSPAFMEADLARSAIPPEVMGASPSYLVEAWVTAAYQFPYFHMDGSPILDEQQNLRMYRQRQEINEADVPRNRNVGKYDQPPSRLVGELASIPYIHPLVWECGGDALYICEGEKKALSLMYNAGVPAIAIAGKDNWHLRGNQREVHPWISEAIAKGGWKRVFIIPDGDVQLHHIMSTYTTFAAKLEERDLEVTLFELPSASDKLDDLIVKWLEAGEDILEQVGGFTPITERIETHASLLAEYNLTFTITGRDSRPVVHDIEANYAQLLMKHPAFRDYWYNIDTDRMHRGDQPVDNLYSIALYFQRNLSFHRANVDKVMRAAWQTWQAERSRSPMLDAIRSTEWDRVKRIERMFVDYCGAPETEVVLETGRKWLPAAIQRMVNPGCILDYMVVVQGTQGIGKSSLPGCIWGNQNVAWISGDQQTKDRKDAMHSGLVANMDEMAVMYKSDLRSLKSEITLREDLYRPAYAKNKVTRPRRFVMYGSVNDEHFLPVDESGQRRYAVIPVQRVDFQRLEEDAAQLWAEAYYVWERHLEPRLGNIDSASEDAKQYTEIDEPYLEILAAAEARKFGDTLFPLREVDGVNYYCGSFKAWCSLAGYDSLGGRGVSGMSKSVQRHMRADGWLYMDQCRVGGQRMRSVWMCPAELLE